MSNDVFVFRTESDFENGMPENTVYTDGALTLAEYAGCFMQAGSYTTPEIEAPAFRALAVSWNAAAPKDTATELFFRTGKGENWTPWISCGKWSPFSRRASEPATEINGRAAGAAPLQMENQEEADRFQLRICLYSGDIRKTPRVSLIAASPDVIRRQEKTGEPMHGRCLPVPAYSQQVRDPRIRGEIGGAVCAAMLMNRWGEDLLPEEAAHVQYDFAGGYHNLSFLSAAAGSWGYECYTAFTDIAGLKKEIRSGFACAVRIRREDAAQSRGSFAVVRGFETDEDGTEFVLMLDPDSAGDNDAARRLALDEFRKIWQGEALLLHGKENTRVTAAPERTAGELHAVPEAAGEYALWIHGERHSLPVDFCGTDGKCTGTVCYTLRDECAYATTAHKRFYYTDITPDGNIRLDTQDMPAGTRVTVYLINAFGSMTAAELTLP